MKSLSKWKELGDRYEASRVLNGLGELARLQDEYERAGKFYEQCLKIQRELRDFTSLSNSLFNFSWVLLRRNDYRTAKALVEENLKLFTEDGDLIGIILCLAEFATVLGMAGKLEEAARLFSAFESLIYTSGARTVDPPDQKEIDHYLGILREELDEAAFAKAWAEGCKMTMEQAVAFALKETGS